jgi:hypothetical protein
MDIGNRYIVFIKKGNDGDLFIDNCGNSGEIEKSYNIIQKVIALSRHK